MKILTWSGLRGGISVARALSPPHGTARDITLRMTYAAVAFSIVVQRLSLDILARKAFATALPASRRRSAARITMAHDGPYALGKKTRVEDQALSRVIRLRI